MTDVHSHILPGIDDGSDSFETSLRMLALAEESGVHTIVATPHYDPQAGFDNHASRDLLRLRHSLAEVAQAEGIGISIRLGMEIMASDDTPELLEEGRLWTLCGTRYFLVEFLFDEEPAKCFEILSRCRKRGFRPIIAHPERYRFIRRDPQIAYEFCLRGYGLQINKGSLLGRFGEETRITAMRLVSHGLAACVASDAHGAERRTPHMGKVRELLTEEFGEEYAELLLTVNPARIIAGGELAGFEPRPFI